LLGSDGRLAWDGRRALGRRPNLRADSINDDVFVEMEEEYRKMRDEFSGTKDELFSRERRFEMMRRGTLFLRQLLSSIDPKKLRKRKKI